MSAATFQQPETDFYRQSADKALAALGTDARLGLSEGEARARLQRHGGNELAAENPVPGLFSNKWLWGAVLLSLLLQAAVIYIPFLQQAFSTARLSAADWLFCAAVASSVLWLRELSKVIARTRTRRVAGGVLAN